MAEETSKISEGPNQLILQNEKIRECLDKFPELQQKVGNMQLGSIQTKYQYFLRKFQKFTEEHQKYKLMYENIENMVEESNQIKQENRSIEFVKKIMEDTQKRYNILKENIDTLRKNKEQTRQQLLKLKQILKKIKRDYFQLQRKEIQLNQAMKEVQKIERRNEIHKTMFKIRIQKKVSSKAEGKIKPIPLQKLAINSSGIVDHKISQQLQLINKIKQQFLESIGISITEFYKLSEKSFAQQSYANELIKKRLFKIKDKCVLKGIENYDPKDSAVQVFKIVQQYQREKDKIMSLTGPEILDLIIRKNKVGEILHLIEQEKRDILKTYKTCKNFK